MVLYSQQAHFLVDGICYVELKKRRKALEKRYTTKMYCLQYINAFITRKNWGEILSVALEISGGTKKSVVNEIIVHLLNTREKVNIY